MCQEADLYDLEEKTQKLSEEELRDLAQKYKMKSGDRKREPVVVAMNAIQEAGFDPSDGRALDIVMDVLEGRITSSGAKEFSYRTRRPWSEPSRDCASYDQS